MEVSIVIVNYNTFELTCNCIRSVLNNTTDLKYELILVDNGSNECDPKQFKLLFPSIKLVPSGVNLGFSKGNNLGINHAKGRAILLLNSDTTVLRSSIRAAYDKLIADPEIGVVTVKVTYPDGSPQAVAGRFPSITRELRELFRLNKLLKQDEVSDYYLADRFDYSCEKEVDWVWGTFFMFNKKLLDSFPEKKLHENFFMYVEDIQWCYFIKRKLAKKILFYPKAHIVHYLDGSTKRKVNQNEKYLKKIMPNEFDWISQEKGALYARFYYLTKAVHLLTLREKKNHKKAKYILSSFVFF